MNKLTNDITLIPPKCACGCGNFVSRSKLSPYDWNKYYKSEHARIGKHISEDHKKKISLANKGKKQSEEHINKLSASRKGRKLSEEHKTKIRLSMLGKNRRPCSEEKKKLISQNHSHISPWLNGMPEEIKKRISLANTGRIRTSETRKLMSEKRSSFFRKYPEHKERLREIGLELWKNPEHVNKIMVGRSIRPNKPETVILNILTDLYPNEWKYTGDFSFMINGKNPDFTNINGQKKLIELFGDYWHKGENPQDRINIFKKFGYDTLVIWESELKNIEKVKRKIQKFGDKRYEK